MIREIYTGGNVKERGHLGRPRSRWVDNIKLVLKKYDGRAWTGLMWPRIRGSDGLLFGSIKCAEFDWLRKCWCLQRGCASWG